MYRIDINKIWVRKILQIHSVDSIHFMLEGAMLADGGHGEAPGCTLSGSAFIQTVSLI
jgi:hypothetical protein